MDPWFWVSGLMGALTFGWVYTLDTEYGRPQRIGQGLAWGAVAWAVIYNLWPPLAKLLADWLVMSFY